MNKKGYKHTSLGWIPEDWEVKRLEEISEIQQGVSKGRSISPEDAISVPYMRVANVKDGVIDLAEVKEIVINKNELSRYTLLDGDILITEGGDPDQLGRGGIWTNSIKNCVFQNHLFRIRTDRSKLDQFFLYNYFQGFSAKAYFLSCAKQTTGIASINSSQVRATPISLPSVLEQRRITAITATWDAAIYKVQRLVDTLQIRHRGLMHVLLSGKKRLKGFEGKWSNVTYGDLLSEVKRPVLWNDDDLYRLISVRRRSGGIFERESLYGHQIKVKDLRTACAGDFLFSKMQIVHGASALVPEDFDRAKISGSYIAVVSKNSRKLDINFFDWHSRRPYFYHQTYISSFGVHIEKMTFDFEAFLSLDMALPPLEEQIAIVNILNASDREIQLHRRRLATLQEQKKGLMQVLLTGKVRVKPKEE